MKNYYLVLALTDTRLVPTPSQSDTNYFGVGGILELDLGDNEIALPPKQEREQITPHTPYQVGNED